MRHIKIFLKCKSATLQKHILIDTKKNSVSNHALVEIFKSAVLIQIVTV